MTKRLAQSVTDIEPSADNPRNSEGSIIELNDGRLFLAYSHFYGGHADDSPAYIAGRYSADGGRTWDAVDTTVVQNEGQQNVMSVSLLRLKSGEIAMFYEIKHSPGDCRLYMRESRDETRTWSEKVCCIPNDGYFVINNDRPVQLSTGRVVVPAAHHPCPDGTWHTWSSRATSTCFFSDDGGNTWNQSSSVLEAPAESRSGLQEPGILEMKDGFLMMWTRTDLGCQYISYSFDCGNSWEEPRASELMSPCSPASIKRVPSTGDLLCVYNDHSGRFPYPEGKRTPLVAALSSDGGATWKHHRLIEDDPDGWYCYTSITFVEDAVLLSYCAGDSRVGGLNRLRIRRIPCEWLYHKEG